MIMDMLEKRDDMKSITKNDVDIKWTPRKEYALTLNEIHFIFAEFLNNYIDCEQLGDKQLVNEIENLRSWITNATFYGERL